jgi:hypothetical protein
MVHLLNFLDSRERQGQGLGNLVQLKWPPACKHGLQSLGQALAASQSKCNKVSVPAMDQGAALSLVSSPVPRLSIFAQNLTSLILQFATADRDGLSQLSPHFQRFLSRLSNVEAIHIGFPMAQPLDVRLEDIFHGIRWPKLKALGIQAWRLGPNEIIDIARRHKRTLHGLRLREVLLKEGFWSDILNMLRSEMEALDWVSLRRIDYASHFDNVQEGQGFEIGDEDLDPDHQAFGAMTIDDSSSSDGNDAIGGEQESEASTVGGDDVGSVTDSNASNDGSDHNPVADQLDLPVPLTPVAVQVPRQHIHNISLEELGDDGIAVTGRQKTKAWELWVTNRRTH